MGSIQGRHTPKLALYRPCRFLTVDRNHHEWADANPRATVTRHSQFRFKINYWVGILGNNVLGAVELPKYEKNLLQIFHRALLRSQGVLQFFSCLCAFAAAAPQNYYQPQASAGKSTVPIVSETNEINPDGSFSYSVGLNAPKLLQCDLNGSPSTHQKLTPCRNLNSQDFDGKFKDLRDGLRRTLSDKNSISAHIKTSFINSVYLKLLAWVTKYRIPLYRILQPLEPFEPIGYESSIVFSRVGHWHFNVCPPLATALSRPPRACLGGLPQSKVHEPKSQWVLVARTKHLSRVSRSAIHTSAKEGSAYPTSLLSGIFIHLKVFWRASKKEGDAKEDWKKTDDSECAEKTFRVTPPAYIPSARQIFRRGGLEMEYHIQDAQSAVRSGSRQLQEPSSGWEVSVRGAWSGD
ncbi:hypothetical protein NQ318_007065 [Aromia moschata]|uniref:Uncharacterized protein n=1 Tax=Aromia moschata TaxID=1265417 RepID=A0AAV8XAD2_9CUCU|nr:hypothetical protein NQ318_007065 [Aromia moschata]